MIKLFAKHKFLLMMALLLLQVRMQACVTCNKELQAEIYDSTFFPNLFIMLSAFFVLALIVWTLAWAGTKHHKTIVLGNTAYNALSPVPVITAAMILGIGLGGFIDGIVFHQILQWHEMLSNKVPVDTLMGKSVNMFWDGIFHLFCLLVVLVGLISLWKLFFRSDVNRSGKLLSGGMLLGWGLFNIVEGLIDHHLLKLHNIKETTPNKAEFNIYFLVFSLLITAIGYFSVYHKNQHKVHI